MNMRIAQKVVVGALVLAVGVAGGVFLARRTLPVRAEPPERPAAPVVSGNLAGLESNLTAIYEQVNPSVVNVQVLAETKMPEGLGELPGVPDPFQFFFGPQGPGGQGEERGEEPRQPRHHYDRAGGSGFVWDTDGHIVTNNHVVKTADKITVTFADGTECEAQVVGTDPDSDLAVLKVDLPAERLKPVKVANSDSVKVGQLAIAIGNPFGLEGTMTVGFISALGRLLPLELNSPAPSFSIPDVIQTDAPINPGNSGGVLVNSQGQLVGVPTAIIAPSGASAGIGFAIPSAIVEKAVPALIRTGRFEHTWLGISGVTLTPEIAKAMGLKPDQRGALVVEVNADSPADKAGIRGGGRTAEIDGVPVKVGGDVIIGIGDQEVRRFDDIVAYLARETTVGQTVPIKLLRDGRPKSMDVTLEARPASPQPPAQEAAVRPGRAWLGISGADLRPAVAKVMGLDPSQRGVLVAEVEAGSPADKAGLRGSDKLADVEGQRVSVGGDVITQANGRPVASMNELQRIVNRLKPGDKLKLTVLRGGAEEQVTVTLGERPR